MIQILLLLRCALTIRLYTPITQNYKLLIADDLKMHPWFYLEEQAFVDWESNKVRQFVAQNYHNYTINVTISIISEIDAYIQESLKLHSRNSDQFQFTLLPKQEYKIAIEYNCTSTEPETIHLEVVEQTLKHSTTSNDDFYRYQIRIIKYCVNPPLNHEQLFVLFMAYFITLLSPSYVLVSKSKALFTNSYTEFSKELQILTLILIPIFAYMVELRDLWILSFVVAFISIWDLIKSIMNFKGSSYLAFGIAIVLCTIHMKESQINLSIILACVVQVCRRVIIKSYIELFVLLVVIWIQEINWLAHYHTVEKHQLTKVLDQQPLFFQTSLRIQSDSTQWNQRYIEIQLYQLIALALINSFIFRNGLFNLKHIGQIIITQIFYALGLVIYHFLYIYKFNPPLLTLVTGCILIGIALNQFIFKAGLDNPFMKFAPFQLEETKIKD